MLSICLNAELWGAFWLGLDIECMQAQDSLSRLLASRLYLRLGLDSWCASTCAHSRSACTHGSSSLAMSSAKAPFESCVLDRERLPPPEDVDELPPVLRRPEPELAAAWSCLALVKPCASHAKLSITSGLVVPHTSQASARNAFMSVHAGQLHCSLSSAIATVS